MAQGTAPAYQWYVKDWRSSRKVQLMSFKVRGMYREMLDEQWDSGGSLPNDPAELAVLLGGSESDWAKHLPQIRANFKMLDDGRLMNERLEVERVKQRNRSQSGHEGGKARAAAAPRSGGRFTSAPPANAGESTSGDAGPPPDLHLQVQSADCSLQVQGRAAPAPPDARSKRPIFTGQKLTVFEWMFDDHCKILGTHTDSFDLHEWYFALDARMVREHLVQPKRDSGAWLDGELVAEAQKRGLSIRVATPPTAGKLTSRLAGALANIKREAVNS